MSACDAKLRAEAKSVIKDILAEHEIQVLACHRLKTSKADEVRLIRVLGEDSFNESRGFLMRYFDAKCVGSQTHLKNKLEKDQKLHLDYSETFKELVNQEFIETMILKKLRPIRRFASEPEYKLRKIAEDLAMRHKSSIWKKLELQAEELKATSTSKATISTIQKKTSSSSPQPPLPILERIPFLVIVIAAVVMTKALALLCYRIFQ